VSDDRILTGVRKPEGADIAVRRSINSDPQIGCHLHHPIQCVTIIR